MNYSQKDCGGHGNKKTTERRGKISKLCLLIEQKTKETMGHQVNYFILL